MEIESTYHIVLCISECFCLSLNIPLVLENPFLIYKKYKERRLSILTTLSGFQSVSSYSRCFSATFSILFSSGAFPAQRFIDFHVSIRGVSVDDTLVKKVTKLSNYSNNFSLGSLTLTNFVGKKTKWKVL